MRRRGIVLVADPVPQRAERIKRVLQEDYEVAVCQVGGWDELTSTVQDTSIKLVILADGIPGRGTIYHRIRYLETSPFYPYTIGLVGKIDVRELDIPDHAQLLETPDGSLDIAEFRQCLDRCLPRPLPLPICAFLDEQDLVLRQQVCALDPQGREERAKTMLQRIVRDLREDCHRALVWRLSQGYSGSLVFRVDMETESQSRSIVLKLTQQSGLWKVRATLARYEEIEGQFRHNPVRHMPRLLRPDRPSKVSDFLVEQGGYFGEAHELLGGQLGLFYDFEEAYRRHQERPEKLVKLNFFEPDESLAEAFLRRTLIVLRDFLYGRAESSSETLWKVEDAIYPAVMSAPPYQFTGWWKALILATVERFNELGKRQDILKWNGDTNTIKSWLTNGPQRAQHLLEVRSIAVSPVHADLNKNNMLLYIDEGIPFLIDFTTYQTSGHIFQDFALLETQVKFALMDREYDSKLVALDHTPGQLRLWSQAEAQLICNDLLTPEEPELDPEALHTGGVRRAFKIVRLIRREALDIHTRAHGEEDIPSFATEYAAALLFHTLRSIALSELSSFKRLLAVESAARLIRYLEERSS